MAEKMQCLWSRARHAVLAKLNLRCELFRDEVGTQLNCLKDVQGQLDGGDLIGTSCGYRTNRKFRKNRYGGKCYKCAIRRYAKVAGGGGGA